MQAVTMPTETTDKETAKDAFLHASLYLVEVKAGPRGKWFPLRENEDLVACPVLVGAKWKANLASKRFFATRIVRYSQPEVIG